MFVIFVFDTLNRSTYLKQFVASASATHDLVRRFDRVYILFHNMPVDYKLRTLRHLFGESSFLKTVVGKPMGKTKRLAPGFKPSLGSDVSPKPDPTERDSAQLGADAVADTVSIQSAAPAASSVLQRPKKSSGITRAFFSNQPPRSVKGKAVSGQLWGNHLWEKQKMKVYYGAMGDKQFKRYVEKAKERRFNTDAALMRFLEVRLDTFLYRTGFVKSPMQARQWIFHGQVHINERRVTVKNFALTPGDVMRIRHGFEQHAYLAQKGAAEYRKSFNIGPSWIVSNSDIAGMVPWMEIDRTGLAAALVRYPTDQELRALQHATLLPFIKDASMNPHAAMRAYR